MSTYTRKVFTTSDALTADSLNEELEKIETAVNNIDDTNIDSLSPSALSCPNACYGLTFEKSSIGAGVPFTTIQDTMVVPVDCTLWRLYAICETASGASSPRVDVYDSGGSTILNSPVSLLAGLKAYSGSIATTTFYAGDYLTLRAETSGSGGAITNLKVVMLFKALHVA